MFTILHMHVYQECTEFFFSARYLWRKNINVHSTRILKIFLRKISKNCAKKKNKFQNSKNSNKYTGDTFKLDKHERIVNFEKEKF